MSKRVPDWVLERSLVGELPEGFTEADLAADPTVPERLAALRASDEEILQKHPPEQVASRVRQRADQRREPRVRPAIRWASVAVAATLVAVITPLVMRQQPDDIFTKGLQPHLEMYRQGSNGEEKLTDGAVAHPGDVIQLRIVPAGAVYAAVVAMDGTGEVSLVAPAAGGPALELPKSGSFTLPDALQLDASGTFERFLLVTRNDRPFQADEVLAEARKQENFKQGTIPLPREYSQSAFTIGKEP